MKNFLAALAICCTVTSSLVAQVDSKMMERLDSVLIYTQQSKFENLLDLTYPGLFKIVTREQMLEALKGALETEEFTASIDSVKLEKMHPLFTSGGGSYVKINHSMLMLMKFREPIDTTDNASLNLLVKAMEEGMGAGNVRFDKKNNTFRVFMLSSLVAIKDKNSPEWTFLNYDDDQDDLISSMLFSKEVLDKLKALH